MKIGDAHIVISDIGINLKTSIYYSKKYKVFEIAIPEQYRDKASDERLAGESEAAVETRLVEYLRRVTSLEDRLEKIIIYRFTADMNPPNGEIGSTEWNDVWGVDLIAAVDSGSYRDTSKHHKGVSIGRACGSHLLQVDYQVLWVDPTGVRKVYYEYREHYEDYRQTYDSLSGEEVPYTEAKEQFFANLCKALDELATSAARWLLQADAVELMEGAPNLLGGGRDA